MKKFIKICTVVLLIFSVSILSAVCYYDKILPDNISIYKDESVHFNTIIPISQNSSKDAKVSSQLNAKANNQKQLSLMGIIPIKSVNISKFEQSYVLLSGENFGIKIFTKGVMVVGLSDVNTNSGSQNPAKKAGLKIGDIVLKANGVDITSNSQFTNVIKSSKTISLVVSRENMIINTTLVPVLSTDGSYKAGLWVRDSTAGIGTMTFYSPVDGSFAGLGHAIVDVDTGVCLPVNSGEIVGTNILSIKKGQKGCAGEICGAFTDRTLGVLYENCEKGLYGTLNNYNADAKVIKIASSQSVREGKAKIYTSIDNSGPKYYDCEIENIYYNDSEHKNLLIKITDEDLIEKTGGIVQGMSGSPIVQNGQLVGALTNVFLNDPQKGYGIFAETMLETSQKTTNQKLKKAS